MTAAPTEPVLLTERLILRPPSPDDAGAVYDLIGDPRTTVHNPSDRLGTIAEAEDLLDRWIGHWTAHGFGYWCVRQVDRPDVIGVCGCKLVTFRSAPALNLLYRFVPAVWGRGYASEAAIAVVDWTQAGRSDRPLIARIRPDNLVSQRVAARAGLRHRPALDEDGEDGPDLLFVAD